eukprot:CAMPEP_0184643520 /NCGR_PEP_ID=MMETSP0308-20130426/372_1 /TAXON_ID=38269 /ORGANISM="Gloeochaete witrockiana, Strain SAG 46.84" /LENGTH=118 /DNA_ID=CAMNT_0027071511 /DNA_START=25 /DNA_END=381 /DNA_ORIENTATION=+
MADSDAQKGIQALLAAEQDASEVVAKARRNRAARVKQAADEAQSEIRSYKLQREEQFIKYASEHMGAKGDRSKQLDGQTATMITKIKSDVSSKKNDVIKMLIDYVIDVDLTLPAPSKA